MPPRADGDDALLARLNALKQSSISLSTAPPTAADELTPDALRDLGIADDRAPTETDDDADPILDLAARFKRLNNPSPSPRGGGAAAAASSAVSADATAGGEEGKSLDKLLKELGGEGWDVSRGEERDVGRLVREVRSVLPDVPTPTKRLGGAEGMGQQEDGVGDGGGADGDDGDEVDQEALDEQEADDYIAQVLAELDLDVKYGFENEERAQGEGAEEQAARTPGNGGESPAKSPVEGAAPEPSKAEDDEEKKEEGEGASTVASLCLPAAPTDLPTPPAMKDDFDRATAVDDALTARLAALSRGSPGAGNGGAASLPSAPSFAPSKKPPVKTSKFTDEEIDSWCIICYANATVRCLGCDGDLYCQGCWNEGHRGESAGYEERSHRAVQFVKGGGLKKMPVGAG